MPGVDVFLTELEAAGAIAGGDASMTCAGLEPRLQLARSATVQDTA